MTAAAPLDIDAEFDSEPSGPGGRRRGWVIGTALVLVVVVGVVLAVVLSGSSGSSGYGGPVGSDPAPRAGAAAPSCQYLG